MKMVSGTWIVLLIIVCSCISSPLLANVANAPLPRIAVYPFVSSVDSPEYKQFGVTMSELLLVELSGSDSIELLDRSVILNVFEEKGITGKKGGSGTHSKMLEKVPVSEVLITGFVISESKRDVLSLRIVNSATAKILESLLIPVDKGKPSRAITMISDFIIKNVSLIQRTVSNKRAVGFGTIENKGGNPGAQGKADLLREGLIYRYKNKLDVLARTQMFPLWLESYIYQLQFKSTDIRSTPAVSIYIFGDYRITTSNGKQTIQLNLYIAELEEKGGKLVELIEGGSWQEIYRKSTNFLDRYILPLGKNISDDQAKRANALYELALNLNGYKKGLSGRDQEGKQWFFPRIHAWEDDNGEYHDKTVKMLRVAIKNNPQHWEARLVLALTLMGKNKSGGTEAREQLIWLSFHSDNYLVRKRARQELKSRPLFPNSFKGIVDDVDSLYLKLIKSGYLRENGQLRGDRGFKATPDLDIFGYDYKEIVSINNILWQKGRILIPNFSTSEPRSINSEANFHYFKNKKSTGISIKKNSNYSLVENLDPASDKEGRKKLHHAIDGYLAAILLDRQFFMAQIYLAHMFRSFGVQYLPYADILFENVLNSTGSDKIKFLASLPIDKLLETEFTQSFRVYIGRYIDEARNRNKNVEYSESSQDNRSSSEVLSQGKISIYDQTNSHISVKKVSIKSFLPVNKKEKYGVKPKGVIATGGQLIIGMGSKDRSGVVSIFSQEDGVWKLEQILKGVKPTDHFGRDWFGQAVDARGDLLLVGAPRDDAAVAIKEEMFIKSDLRLKFDTKRLVEILFERGYVDIYGFPTVEFKKGYKEAKMDFPKLAERDVSLLMSMLERASSEEDVGTAQVFRKYGGQWVLDANLAAPDAYIKNHFGSRVSIGDDTAIVCAQGRNPMSYGSEQTSDNNPGAYVFEKGKTGWEYDSKVYVGRCFDTAFSGGLIFAITSRNGKLVVFKKINGTWQEWRSILLDVSGYQRPGSIAIDALDEYMAVTTPWDDKRLAGKTLKRAGAVHIFKFVGGQWQADGKLYGPGENLEYAEFGSSVAFNAGYLAVGAQSKTNVENANIPEGKVYLYGRRARGWELTTIISPADGDDGGKFGGALSFSDDALIIGSTNDNGRSKIYQYSIN